jgi:hypothetical protein
MWKKAAFPNAQCPMPNAQCTPVQQQRLNSAIKLAVAIAATFILFLISSE